MLNLIVMFICGAVFSASVLVIVMLHIFGDDFPMLTDDDLKGMCEWYDAEYENEN